VVALVLLVALFAGPFVWVDGHPLFLFNVLERRFIFFGVSFWPQDFYLVAFGLVTFIVFITLYYQSCMAECGAAGLARRRFSWKWFFVKSKSGSRATIRPENGSMPAPGLVEKAAKKESETWCLFADFVRDQQHISGVSSLAVTSG
jgi:hypothetical protein